MTTLYTIGYEGASLADFVATLQVAGVQHVMDIRDVPQSRRPGFSKNVLAAALQNAGISYSHVKSLGDPKAGREAARRGDHDGFLAIFEAHLGTPEAKTALVEAAAAIQEKPTTLLCYERDPKTCHRAIVGQRLKDVCSLNVQHLGVRLNGGRQRGTVAEAA
jgi:uncharacterized protein (DUF488 family)